MATRTLTLNWNTPKSGVELRRFQASDAAVRAIMGPQGSGKTTVCLSEFGRRAVRQTPSPIDGVRHTSWVAIRDTYRQLENTTIPSWFSVIPREIGEFTGGGGGEPAKHRIAFETDAFGKVEFTVYFIAIGDRKVEDVLRGLQVTGGYLNEMDLLAREVMIFLRGRIGRFPNMKEHGVRASWRGVWGDFNAPDTDNYCYDMFVENKPDGFEFFRQRGGLDALAENIENLPESYYQEQMAGQPDWWIRRMVHNEFGFSRAGTPIYPEYSDLLHVAPAPIKAIKGRIIKIGIDAGRTPAALLTQMDSEGQFRALDEVIHPDRIGAKTYGEYLSRFLAEKYPHADVVGIGDPAAFHPGDQSEEPWMEIVANTVRMEIIPAPSNNPVERWEAVRQPLTRLIGAHKPAFQLSPTCRVTRRGFNSGYHFRNISVGGKSRTLDRAEKTPESHPHDALQYAALDATDYGALLGREASGNFGKTIVEAAHDEW